MSCLPFREPAAPWGTGRRYYHRALSWPTCCAATARAPPPGRHAAEGRRQASKGSNGRRVARGHPAVDRSRSGDADRVFRVAFGTFLGVPEPRKFFGDAEFVRTRWHADNDAAFAAVREGRLVG